MPLKHKETAIVACKFGSIWSQKPIKLSINPYFFINTAWVTNISMKSHLNWKRHFWCNLGYYYQSNYVSKTPLSYFYPIIYPNKLPLHSKPHSINNLLLSASLNLFFSTALATFTKLLPIKITQLLYPSKYLS